MLFRLPENGVVRLHQTEGNAEGSAYCTLSSTKGRCSHDCSGFVYPSKPALPLCVYKLGLRCKVTHR